MKHILLVEDSNNLGNLLKEEIEKKVKRVGRVVVTVIRSELEFRRKLSRLVDQNFDLVIFDVMVLWCSVDDLGDNHILPETPEEVQKELSGDEPFRGGVRCSRLFKERLFEKHETETSMFFYSIVDRDDLDESLSPDDTHLLKTADFEPLIEKINELLK
ncbi:MAG: hypothetical protein MI748_10565 [Opitutales bacterium]|nr:hypothetical protein [Opitutales bacterium]